VVLGLVFYLQYSSAGATLLRRSQARDSTPVSFLFGGQTPKAADRPPD